MSLADLDQIDKRVLMFGGKGGVGKTTTSATTALHFALAGKRTLILSSDLTPSLSDIFETEIGATETPIPGVDNLWGLEIDPDEVMRRWKVKFGPEIYEASQVFVDMPYDEVVEYVAMAPGIQEEFMLDFVVERVRDGRYDLVVVNILARVIVEMLQKGLGARMRPGGMMVAAGIIIDQEAHVTEALGQGKLALSNRQQKGDWVCLVAERA